MSTQLERLEPLRALVSPEEPPARVDRRMWQSLTPSDNALSAVRVELGKKLYFDTRLSKDNTVACATCHDVTRAFTDLRKTSEGIGGQEGKRNAPTTMNAALLSSQFWDGREASVEDQARMPIINPIEMGFASGEAAAMAIAGDPEYRRLFQAAYGSDPNYGDIGRAIGAFERTLIFLDAPLDAFLASKKQSANPEKHQDFGPDAQRGWLLFNGKARCVACHPLNPVNPIGSDGRFHNIGVAAKHQNFEALAVEALRALKQDPTQSKLEELAVATDFSELGRFMVTKNYSDIGAFRSPQLRNVGITGPYMHDGSMASLWDVIDHYNKGGEANAYLDGGIEALDLSESEIDDLVALLFAMTDTRFSALNAAEMQRQRALSKESRPNRDTELATRKKIPFDQRN